MVCPVLDWAASGAMALTGHPGAAASVSPAPAFAMGGRVLAELTDATGQTGSPVRADPAVLLTGRAALAGFTRRGQVSAGGATRLLRAADGWCAVTLSRTEDRAAVPAILSCLGRDGASPAGTDHAGGDLAGACSAKSGFAAADEAWPALQAAASARGAEALVAAARLLGVPAAVLPRASSAVPAAPPPGPVPAAVSQAPPAGEIGSWPPWRAERIAAPSPAARLAGAVVADLSSMWAGPLCARLLGLAGARVVKVETQGRPDGARAGERRFFDWLHAGHESLLTDFRTTSGRATLAALLDAADVVIEASRPRALANLGLAPDMIPHRDGQVWLSITGYGRAEPALVAFGDDAAVAGGLVGWADGEPVFCADAIADPLTGVCGALAIARSLAAGGGELIDLSMRAVAASFAAAPATCPGPHRVRSDSGVTRQPPGLEQVCLDGTVTCQRLGREQAVLPPRASGPCRPAADPGADTDAVLAWLAPC